MAHMRSWLLLSAAFSGMAVSTAAWSQSAEGLVAETGAGDDIIVTAQKRAQNVQQVPAAMTAIGTDQLEMRGITSPRDLQFAVPSMQTGNLLGMTSVTIRGVGLNQGSPGVAIHLDGVYQARPALGDIMQTDLARIEVLRGPQGTLYGRNANGGAINYITNAPTDSFEGYIQAGVATYQEFRVQGLLNVPIQPWMRARLVLDWSKRNEGFVSNAIPGGEDADRSESLSGRLRIDADLGSNFDLSLTGSLLRADGPMQYFVLRNLPTDAAMANLPVLATATYAFEPWRTTANDPINTERQVYALSANATWRLGDFTLKSITGMSWFNDDSLADDDGINVSVFPARRYYDSETFSQELNLSGSFDAFDFVAGIFYLNDSYSHILDYDLKEGFPPLPPGSELYFGVKSFDTESRAAFLDITIRPASGLSIFGGLRYSREDLEQTQRNHITFGTMLEVPTCPLRTNEASYDSTTPRFGARYEFSDAANVYVTYSKGFKAGGFNDNACDNPFNPEQLTAYEGGIKSRPTDNLTLNVAVFHYDYTDLQISQVIGLGRFITNAAAAKVDGFEVESLWRPDESWSFNASLSWLNARYTSFINIDGLDPALGKQDLAGNRLNDAPEWSSNIGASYTADLGSAGTLTARLDASFRSTTYFREFNNPLDSQSGYEVLNATLMWQDAAERFRVRLYGTNLTNSAYIARMDASDNFGARFISWGAPRQIGLEARVMF